MSSDITNSSFVSRGGLKLQHAIRKWKLDIRNFVVLDVGSSTGGFVDCLLQNGAAKVYSVDTAYGELAWKLRNDERVVVMERTNILHLNQLPKSSLNSSSLLQRGRIEEGDEEKVDLITIDASWTKLELILPVIKGFLKENGYIIALLKPHYEAGKELLVKGVLPDDKLEMIVEKVKQKITSLGFKIEKEIESPIQGGGGNREFLWLISYSQT